MKNVRPLIGTALQELVQEKAINSEQSEAIIKKLESVSPTAEDVASKELIVKAYKDNAKYVIKEAQEIIPLLKGKVIISADHGTFLGEDGRFGHGGKEHPILRTVPWLEVGK